MQVFSDKNTKSDQEKKELRSQNLHRSEKQSFAMILMQNIKPMKVKQGTLLTDQLLNFHNGRKKVMMSNEHVCMYQCIDFRLIEMFHSKERNSKYIDSVTIFSNTITH